MASERLPSPQWPECTRPPPRTLHGLTAVASRHHRAGSVPRTRTQAARHEEGPQEHRASDCTLTPNSQRPARRSVGASLPKGGHPRGPGTVAGAGDRRTDSRI